MSWYAVDSVDTAIDATRKFLFPFSLVRWTKLAVIAFFLGFVGGSSNPGSTSSGFSGASGSVPQEVTYAQPDDVPPALAQIDPTTIAAIVAGIVLLALLVALVAEAFRFVFYDAIRRNRVTLWSPLKRRFGQAVRLFGFKFGVVILFAVPFVVAGGIAYLTGVDPDAIGPLVSVGLVALGVYAVVGLLLLVGIVRFTNEFVVPTMTLTDTGVLDGWRTFWPVVRREWKQFAGYLVVHFLLLLAIGIAQTVLLFLAFGIVAALAALAGLILVFGVAGGLEAALASLPVLVALGTIGVFAVIALVLIALPIQIVVLTYVATYELSMLRRAAPDLDLLAEVAPVNEPIRENAGA
ncbi:MAG: DUF7544 domain-containing protein [Halobacteriota archaeon]